MKEVTHPSTTKPISKLGLASPASETDHLDFLNSDPNPRPCLLHKTGKIPLFSLISNLIGFPDERWHGL